MKITVEQSAPASPEDIFYRGNLVVHKNYPEFILLVTEGQPQAEQFLGARLTEWNNTPFGEHSSWYKSQFEQFHGKITFEVE